MAPSVAVATSSSSLEDPEVVDHGHLMDGHLMDILWISYGHLWSFYHVFNQ